MTFQQYYMPRQQKALLGAPPHRLPPIDIHAARAFSPAHHPQTFSPRSSSRSSSLSSNNSWASALNESPIYSASSCFSSNASLYSSPPTTCSPWQEHYNPHHPSINPPSKASFVPPTAALEALLERLSHNEVSQSDLAFIRESLCRSTQAREVVPYTTGTAASVTTVATTKIKLYDSLLNDFLLIKAFSRPAPIKKEKYKTEMCRSWEEQGQCRYGFKCLYAHGPQELRDVPRHPKYKTETGTCRYARRCVFVHSTSLSIEDKVVEKMKGHNAPLLSRVGLNRNAPNGSEHRPTGVEVHSHAVGASFHNRGPYEELSMAEKWGREMSTFPGNWLTSPLIDHTASTVGAGQGYLQAGVRSIMV